MTSLALDYRKSRSWVITAAFIVGVVGIGSLIGLSALPDAWYQSLAKAPWNPPNWVFGPAWSTLYVLIGIAGARTALRDVASPQMLVWILQLVLNFAWSPTWFSLHMIWPAFALISAILVLILTFIVISWKVDRVSAWLFVPYALWVAFASSLNLSIAILN